MSDFYNNSIFWVEVDRISPNPYQPRRDFDDQKIASLADSIRQYGVLQPLTVTRKEVQRQDGGISVEYELIAGERRLRAAKLAGVPQVPVTIRANEETDKMKLELAIIENLQREDLNPIDRAKAFKQLVDEFNLKHVDVAKKVGKSREYVSNTLRLLGLPDEMQRALAVGTISEGHARPLLMLTDRAEERDVLFKEITEKKLTVRESERIARRIAVDRARKQDLPPELIGMEKKLSEGLGTRVQIEQRAQGGKVHIDFFSEEDLQRLLTLLADNNIPTKNLIAHIDTPKQDAIKNFNDTFAHPPLPVVEREVATPSVPKMPTAVPPVREIPQIVVPRMPAPAPVVPREPRNPFMKKVAPMAVTTTPSVSSTPMGGNDAEDADPFKDISAEPTRVPQGSDPFAGIPVIPPSPTVAQAPYTPPVKPLVWQSHSVDDAGDFSAPAPGDDDDDEELYSLKNFNL